MNIEKFSNQSQLVDQVEIRKVELLSFYHLKMSGVEHFTIQDVCNWFDLLGFSMPNTSRLKKKLIQSKDIVRGTQADTFRLHAKRVRALDAQFPSLNENDETIETIDSIIPHSLYTGTRGYIESLAKQINASYENNVFDGCAVLMRRLLEIMLILSYEKIGIEQEIKEPTGECKNLVFIIGNAISNSKLSLSRNSKDCLEQFRKIGNFSAHKVHYNAKKSDVRNVALDFRATIEELLYKSEILK